MTYEAEEVGAAALGSFANSDQNTDASEVAELAMMALEDAAPEKRDVRSLTLSDARKKSGARKASLPRAPKSL